MKLSPPASSSDLDVARDIARRLHNRARGNDVAPAPTAVAPPLRPTPPPVIARPEKQRAPKPPPRRQEPVAAPQALEQERTDPKLSAQLPELEAPALEPELPELASPEFEPDLPELPSPEFEPDLPELASSEFEPEPAELDGPEPDDLPDLESDSFEPEPPPRPPAALFEPELPGLDLGPPTPPPAAAYGADTGEFEPEPPDASEVEEDMFERLPPGGYGPASGSFEAVSNDEPTLGEEGARDEDDALAELTAPPSASEFEGLGTPDSGVSPEDLLSEDPAAPEWAESAALEAEMVVGEEEPQVEVQATSPWDEAADSCLALAPANGVMLVDPAGQVLTYRGEWPEPGPEAIAGRLVSMMEKKLRDAPTRSVSAPLAGQHLTAWRVPAADGYLTVAFMADAPLKADIRPAIDTIVQAAGG